jgi:hypothetical protein
MHPIMCVAGLRASRVNQAPPVLHRHDQHIADFDLRAVPTIVTPSCDVGEVEQTLPACLKLNPTAKFIYALHVTDWLGNHSSMCGARVELQKIFLGMSFLSAWSGCAVK